MKAMGMINTAALFLLLGIAVPALAGQEKPEEKAKPAQHEQQAKPEKQQQAKAPKQEQQAKPEKQQQAKAPKQEHLGQPEKQQQAKAPKQEHQAKPEKQQQQAKAPIQVQFKVPEAFVVLDFKLKGMDWPALQSFQRKPILDYVNTHVCSLVYRSPLSLRGIASHKTKKPTVRFCSLLGCY